MEAEKRVRFSAMCISCWSGEEIIFLKNIAGRVENAPTQMRSLFESAHLNGKHPIRLMVLSRVMRKFAHRHL